MYKILNSHVAVKPDKVDLIFKTRPHRGDTTKRQLKHLAPKTPQYQHSFIPETILDWNNLLDNTTSQASVPSFRSQVVADLAP